MGKALIWAVLLAATLLPLAASTTSSLLHWRPPVYLVAGFAGVLAMALLLVQPLLAARHLPGLQGARGRKLHRVTGATLLICVLVHLTGLWITSPPDVIDALTFTSPTPFSPFGVIALWALLATAGLALFRRKLRLRPRTWARAHKGLGLVIVGTTVTHALLIEGTMEPVSKALLAVLILMATAWALLRPKP